MAQPEQPQPQEDLPFFLSLTIFIIIKAIITAKTKAIIIVPKLAINQVSIFIPPRIYKYYTLTFLVSFVDSL